MPTSRPTRPSTAAHPHTAGACRVGAEMPHAHEVAPRHRLPLDARKPAGPAVVVQRDALRLRVRPEKCEEGVRRARGLDPIAARLDTWNRNRSLSAGAPISPCTSGPSTRSRTAPGPLREREAILPVALRHGPADTAQVGSCRIAVPGTCGSPVTRHRQPAGAPPAGVSTTDRFRGSGRDRGGGSPAISGADRCSRSPARPGGAGCRRYRWPASGSPARTRPP